MHSYARGSLVWCGRFVCPLCVCVPGPLCVSLVCVCICRGRARFVTLLCMAFLRGRRGQARKTTHYPLHTRVTARSCEGNKTTYTSVTTDARSCEGNDATYKSDDDRCSLRAQIERERDRERRPPLHIHTYISTMQLALEIMLVALGMASLPAEACTGSLQSYPAIIHTNASIVAHHDIVYTHAYNAKTKQTEALGLDLYLPPFTGSCIPLAIYVHGGNCISGLAPLHPDWAYIYIYIYIYMYI